MARHRDIPLIFVVAPHFGPCRMSGHLGVMRHHFLVRRHQQHCIGLHDSSAKIATLHRRSKVGDRPHTASGG
jgi:hypothetical protein